MGRYLRLLGMILAWASAALAVLAFAVVIAVLIVDGLARALT